MTTAEERELDALRERVYGPGGDVDHEAVRRLQELEDARRPVVVLRDPLPDAAIPVEELQEISPPEPAPPRRVEIIARWVVERLRRLRRSTVLIALGIVALVILVAVGLTVVNRLQAGPLQANAEEVARLSLDTAYDVPRIFTTGADEAIPVDAFEAFHGLRPIVSEGGIFGRGTGHCLAIFVEADIDDPESESFSGQVMGGCAAGGFPASAQFTADLEGYPRELREAFPDAALQFIYDLERNQVIVFTSPLSQ